MAAGKKLIRVGIVGEDKQDHDYTAIKALLEKQYGGLIQCIQLGRRIEGDQLAARNEKAIKVLGTEFEAERPDIVVYSRDLDALPTDAAKKKKRQQEFDHFNAKAFSRCGLLLLHIFELEALIMADIEAFNKRYNVKYRPAQADAMRIENPKGKLKAATNHRYHESHAAPILKAADYNKLLTGCAYFKAFDDAFRQRLP